MKKNGFVSGSLIMIISIIITKFLGLLYVIPFYNIVGAKGGALYSYSYNIYTIFLSLSSAGLPSSISKITSEYDTLNLLEAKVRTYYIAKKLIITISIVSFLIMFIFSKLIAKIILGEVITNVNEVSFTIKSISFALLVIPSLSIAKGFIQGHKIIKPSSISQVLEQVVRIFIILIGSFITIKVLKLDLKIGVGISVSGAFFGGMAAYIYLKYIIKKNKRVFNIKKYTKKDDITNKEIIIKIISYSFPFIIISTITNLYNFIDMILIIRGLDLFNYLPKDIEFIQSAITTWSNKICTIISSISLGVCINLVPNIVTSNIKRNYKDINNKLNKAYQIILLTSVPLCILIIVLSRPIWYIFYGKSIFGPTILKVLSISTVFSSILNITLNTVQSLNKFKIIYISIFIGFLVNACLDIPSMYILYKSNIPPYIGTILASIIGFIISIIILVKPISKDYKFNFNKTFNLIYKLIPISVVMFIILNIFNHIIGFNHINMISSIIMVITNSILGLIIYIGLCIKFKLISNKYIKKLISFRVS